ncbi:MAG TPA: hypothetical protein VGQ86_07375 [Candidatus Limnocylindria bacterium]|jgi:hypothetical protein|nr:hypothetical protein [Candidatus Limnocylindria bacterium]
MSANFRRLQGFVPQLALAIAIAVVVVALGALVYGSSLMTFGAPGDPLIVVLALIGALVIVALAAIYVSRSDGDTLQGVLAGTAPWLPGAFAVALVAALMLDQPPAYAVSAAVIVSFLLWLGTGFVLRRSAAVDTAQARNFAELVDRVERLEADAAVLAVDERIGRFKEEMREVAAVAVDHLRRILPAIEAELGVPRGKPAAGREYVSGTGYISLWNRVHRCEEAVIVFQPVPSVLAAASHDLLRLDGSNMNDRDKLKNLLTEAIKTLESKDLTPGDEARARGDVRTVREAINRYRDQLWDKMVRTKVQLMHTMLLTGATACAALVLAIIAGVEKTPIVGASAFYLVGAVVGLFARLRSESLSLAVIDDYGLGDARLRVTPLLSGLAAIAGVVLMANVLVPATDVVAPATVDDTGKITRVSSEVRPPATLDQVFDLALNPAGLLAAAVFGLTPGLVLDRLKNQADKYKEDLQVSDVTDSKKG